MSTTVYNVKVCKDSVLVSNQDYDQLTFALYDCKLQTDFFSKYIMLYFKKYLTAFETIPKYKKRCYLKRHMVLDNNTTVNFHFYIKNNYIILTCFILQNNHEYLIKLSYNVNFTRHSKVLKSDQVKLYSTNTSYRQLGALRNSHKRM